MIKFFRSDFGLLVLFNVGFIGGLLAATGLAIGAAIWFVLFATLGYLMTNEKKKAKTQTGSISSGDVYGQDTGGEVISELDENS